MALPTVRLMNNWFRVTPIVAVALALFSMFAFVPFGRIDYDRAHDGFMVASALSVHSGLTLHTDIFFAFGPAVFVKVFEASGSLGG